MRPPKVKGNISRKNLEEHGVFYDEAVYHFQYSIPEHVEAVREILLSFERTVPQGGWETTLETEAKEYETNSEHRPEEVIEGALRPLESSLVPVKHHEIERNDRSPEWRDAFENLKSCEKVAELARSLNAYAENRWQGFWERHTFTVASEIVHNHPGHHRMLDAWSLEGNVLWTEFPNLRPCNTTLAPRTRPKPDLTYAFPVRDCALDELRGFERDVLSTAFTTHKLSTLTERGTICAPTAGLRNWLKPTQRSIMGTTDLACFPWAVVEVKKNVNTPDVSSIERCYCQAANASAAALDIRAQLFNKVSGDAVSSLPPVIAFTCIGHIVKVWLTYFDTRDAERTAQRMVCIWKNSMRLTWGVVTLRKIVMNMHTWASRLLKPRIQACVLQALTMPFVRPEIAPPTPDLDIASSEIFNTPVLVARSNPSNCSTSGTPPLRVDGYGSSSILDGGVIDVLSHPVSPSPLASRVSRQGRPLAVPRRRRSPATPPTYFPTRDVVHSRTTSSVLLTDTNEGQATAVSTTSLTIDQSGSQQATKNADMNCLIRSLDSIQLGDPAPGKNTSNQGTSPFCDQVLETHGGKHTSHDFHTKNSNAEGVRCGSQSALPEMQSVPLPDHHSVIQQISFKAPSISTSLADNSQHATRTANDETLEINASCSRSVFRATEMRQENDSGRGKPASQATSQNMSNLSPRADSRLETRLDNFYARRSSYFRYLVKYQGRLLKMIESLDSLHEGGQGQSLQGGVQNKPEGISMNDKASSVGEHTSSTNTIISNAQSDFPDEPGFRAGMLRDCHVGNFASASDGSSEATLTDGVNVPVEEDGCFKGHEESRASASDHSGSESEKHTSEYQNDRNNKSDQDDANGEDDRSESDDESEHCDEDDESEHCHEDDESEHCDEDDESEHCHEDDESEHSQENDESEHCDEDDESEHCHEDDESEHCHEDDESEHSQEDDESEHSQEDDESEHCDEDDESEHSQEDDESEHSQEDSENDESEDNSECTCKYGPGSTHGTSYHIAMNRRHFTEEDDLWTIGLGSLNGYQLASSTYLRQLFIHRRISTQISMLEIVLGVGALSDDTYKWPRDRDLLGDLLEDLNSLFSSPRITKRAFKRQETGRLISKALRRMSSARATDKFRWHCFRRALAMRSQSVCSDMLCSSAFDFSEDEWSELEDDAKYASEAFYTPRKVRGFLERRFDGV